MLETRLNETLALLMTRTGRTQSDLAEAINVSRAQVSQRLRGGVAWRVSELEPIAGLFGVTVCELLSGYVAMADSGRLPPSREIGQTRI